MVFLCNYQENYKEIFCGEKWRFFRIRTMRIRIGFNELVSFQNTIGKHEGEFRIADALRFG